MHLSDVKPWPEKTTMLQKNIAVLRTYETGNKQHSKRQERLIMNNGIFQKFILTYLCKKLVIAFDN